MCDVFRNRLLIVSLSLVYSLLAAMPAAYAESALNFDAGSSAYVEIPSSPSLLSIKHAITIEAWFRVDSWAGSEAGNTILAKGDRAFSLRQNIGADFLAFKLRTEGGDIIGAPGYWGTPTSPLSPGQWYHVAATWDVDEGVARIYIDGELNNSETTNAAAGALGIGGPDGSADAFFIGAANQRLPLPIRRYWDGDIDEVRLWNVALTEEEIQAQKDVELSGTEAGLVGYWKFNEGAGTTAYDSSPHGNHGTIVNATWTTDAAPVLALGIAYGPSPASGKDDVPRDVTLGWTPSQFAATRDVYFGTSFADVNEAGGTDPRGVLVSQGQTATGFDPGLLDYGTTYYWRIDEVDADFTIFKGNVWSFETEPYAYPLDGVTATASSFHPTWPPDRTVDRSGLDPLLGEHSNDDTDMWLSSQDEQLPAWIQFELPGVRRLHQMKVWNFNANFEPMVGYGAKDVAIEYSLDGEEWIPFEDVVIPQAPGTDTYAGEEPIDLKGIEARFVRLVVESNWSAFDHVQQTGLSEVQFWYAPMHARKPQPADGATGVALDTDLTWRPGREAELHEVHFGTDADAVAAGLALVSSQTQRTYTPPALDLGTTYFWKVDQVGEAATYEGELWSFTTQEFVVVDDFESYDDEDNLIYDAWADGWGIDANGSTVGHLEAVGGTFGERNIVRSGRQSMPLFYENTGTALVSEAVRSLPPGLRDWTAHGIKSLSLYFYGSPDNTGQLYVKINNTKVVYSGDAADLKKNTWQPWNIDLSAVAGNMSRVTTLTIGIEGAGATGLLYIDDIELRPYESPVPVEPGPPSTLGLVDGSGTRQQGTSLDAIRFVAGSSFLADTMYARFTDTSASGVMRMAIYADNGSDAPGTVLGDTAEFAIGSGGLRSAALTTPVQITQGRVYWIATWVQTLGPNVTFVANDGVGTRYRAAPAYSATASFPDGSTLSYSASTTYAVYATGPEN